MVHRSAVIVPSLRRLAGAAGVVLALLLGGCYVAVGVDGVIVGGVSFVEQPDDATVRAGQRATFAVGVAATSTPVTYQWLRDGGSIAGATGPGYETSPTVASDDGARFSVRVCNDRVCVLSDSAVLTVVP